jgi:hypothetical protein
MPCWNDSEKGGLEPWKNEKEKNGKVRKTGKCT